MKRKDSGEPRIFLSARQPTLSVMSSMGLRGRSCAGYSFLPVSIGDVSLSSHRGIAVMELCRHQGKPRCAVALASLPVPIDETMVSIRSKRRSHPLTVLSPMGDVVRWETVMLNNAALALTGTTKCNIENVPADSNRPAHRCQCSPHD